MNSTSSKPESSRPDGANAFKHTTTDDYFYADYFYDDYYYHRDPSTPDYITTQTGFKTKAKDVGFVGYVETSVDPGSLMLVLTIIMCILSIMIVPCLNIWGREYEEWRKGTIKKKDKNCAKKLTPDISKIDGISSKFRLMRRKPNITDVKDLAMVPTQSHESELSSPGSEHEALTPERKSNDIAVTQCENTTPESPINITPRGTTQKSYPPVTKVGRGHDGAPKTGYQLTVKERMMAAVDKILIPSNADDMRTPNREDWGTKSVTDGSVANSVISHRSRSSRASNYSDTSEFFDMALASRRRRAARSHRGSRARRVAEKTADTTQRTQEAWDEDDRRAKAKLYRSRDSAGLQRGVEAVLPDSPEKNNLGPLLARMMDSQHQHRVTKHPLNNLSEFDEKTAALDTHASGSSRGRGTTRTSEPDKRRKDESPNLASRSSAHSDVQAVAASIALSLKPDTANAATSVDSLKDAENGSVIEKEDEPNSDLDEKKYTVCFGPYALWHPSVIKDGLFFMVDLADFDKEAFRIFKLVIPYTISEISESLLELVRVVLISRFLGVESLTAALLVDILVGMTSEFLHGVLDAATSITSHAIGSGNNYLAGQYVQQSMLIYVIANVPFFFLWSHLTKPAILWFGLSENIANLGQDYARVVLWHTIQDGISTALHGLYEVTDHEIFSTIVGLLEGLVGVGITAAAVVILPEVQLTTLAWMDLVVGSTFTVISLIIPLKLKWLKPYVGGLFCNFALTNTAALWTLVRTAAPISVGEFIAYGEWEILTVFSAHLGPAEVSAWAYLGSVWDLFEVSTQGLGDAAEVRVGYHLGSGRPELAQKSSLQCLFWGTMIGTLVSSIFLCVGDDLPLILTKDPVLQHMIAEMLPLVAIGNISMTLGMVAWALVGAQGRYGLATRISTISSWIVTIPLACYFIYWKRYDLKSLAAAVVVGYSIMGTCMSYVLLRSDWKKLSDNIMERNAITGETYSSDEDSDDDDEDSSKSSSSSSSSDDASDDEEKSSKKVL